MIFVSSTEHHVTERGRWIALAVVCMAQLMSIMDGTIVTVALPKIQTDLHFTQSSLSWVLNGYFITFGSFLLLGGRLGDLIGRRRIFLAGIALFTAASAACGLADSQTTLVVARFVQGLGGAGAVAAIVAIIAAEFPDPRERAQAMSMYTLTISAGASIGLIAGGAITQLINWHWIFFINVPIGIATIVFGRAWIAENTGPGVDRRVDVLGSVMITGAMVLLAYAIVTAASHGWASAHTLGFGGAAIVLLAAFWMLESRLRNPIMPPRVFAIRGLPATSLVRGLFICGLYATFFIGTLYMERVRGFGVLSTGIAFLPQTIVLAAMSIGPVTWLVGRFGPRPPMLAGLVFGLAGLVLLSRVHAHTGYAPTLLIAFALMGLGAGLALMPLLTVAMAYVPRADAGLASGIINTSLQMSTAIGVAVLGTISSSHTRTLLRQGSGQVASLLGGYQLAFEVGAGCIAAALVLAIVAVRTPRVERTEEPREREAAGCDAAAEPRAA
jgi:EmrB/QacA subfamily drug resistance transporter